MSIALYLEPILDPNTKEYMDVLTLDTCPEGPLCEFVKRQKLADLSPFTNKGICKYLVMNKDKTKYLMKNDIPYMFSYLQANGYTINKDLTKLYKHQYLVCIFSYDGI